MSLFIDFLFPKTNSLNKKSKVVVSPESEKISSVVPIGEKISPIKLISRRSNNTISENRKKSLNKSSKKSKTKIIQNFMKNTRIKRKSLFLNTICNDSGMCLAFGLETKKIREYFDNYSFEYIVKPPKRIGNDSVNGKVYEVMFERSGYKTYGIIKEMANNDSDNLFYEYCVGLAINKWNLKYPCFIETYYCYYNNYNEIKKIKTIKESCKIGNNKKLLIQHIKTPITFYDYIKRNEYDSENIIKILYQIYSVLSILAYNFTHYDLHGDNILLYFLNEPILMIYNYEKNNEIIFMTKIIVKIIDYGKSYFYLSDNDNSEVFFRYNEEYCNENIPNPHYRCLNNIKKNKSTDLRLLYILKNMYYNREINIDGDLIKLINILTKSYNPRNNYCIDEIETDINKNVINNVDDAHKYLYNIMHKYNPNNYDLYEKNLIIDMTGEKNMIMKNAIIGV
uniref:Protein kinase domain-containing protein n=1 Tax=viral metagenome TaxID=1070528 RepID=A0A6C0H4U2_9ZZZZ